MSECFLGGAAKKKFACGSFTLSQIITAPYTISGLGFTPTGGVLFRTDYIGSLYTDIILELYDSKTQRGLYAYVDANYRQISEITSASAANRPSFGDGTITFYAAATYGNRLNSYTFYWFAWADD